MRTAETVAASLYDLPRDLLPHEAEFITAMHRIGMACARTIGAAARETGPDSKTTLAVRFTANAHRDECFALALAKFEAAHTDIMEDA